MPTAKSLFRNIFDITYTRSIIYAQLLRNFFITGNFGGGRYPAPALKPLHILLSSFLLTACTLSAAAQQATTDPTKLQSKTIENMQTFSIEKLYTTRTIGGTTWSPDGKQIAFVSNISGRKITCGSSRHRRMANLTHHQRAASGAAPPGRPTASGSPMPPTTMATKCGHLPGLPTAATSSTSTTSKEIAGGTNLVPDGKSIAYTSKAKTGSATRSS